MKIPISKIRYSKHFNPRENIDPEYLKSLTLSIKSHLRQIEPILLQAESGELIDGLQRIEASKRAGLKEIDYRFMKCTDAEAREIALVANSFGRKLSPLEIGKAADLILAEVPKRTGREKAKRDLAKKLGLSVSVLEDCLTSHRGIAPDLRADISNALEIGAIGVRDLQQIRTLPHDEQQSLTTLIEQHDSSEARQVVETFIDTHAATANHTKSNTTEALPPKSTAHEQFFPIHKETFRFRIAEPINPTTLLEKFTTFLAAQMEILERKHLREDDLITLTLVLETPHEKTQKVVAEVPAN